MPKGGTAKAEKRSISSQTQETQLPMVELPQKQYLDAATQSQKSLDSAQKSETVSQTSPLCKRSRSESTPMKSTTNTPAEENRKHKRGPSAGRSVRRSTSGMEKYTEADYIVTETYRGGSPQIADVRVTGTPDATPSQSGAPRLRHSHDVGRHKISPYRDDTEVAPCIEERRRLLQQIPLRCIPLYKRLAECRVEADDRSFAAVVTQRAIEALAAYTNNR